MKVCSRCKQEKPFTDYYKDKSRNDGFMLHCKACELAHQKKMRSKHFMAKRKNKRDWYKRHKEEVAERWQRWYADNKHKQSAHNIVRQALLKGVMTKEPCVQCGNTTTDAHHPDYSEPLKVIWLCRKHHQLLHRELLLS